MTNWLSRLFGLSCCGPWSPWERKKRAQMPTLAQAAQFGVGVSDGFVVVKHWQERRCERCGKIQQRPLEY